MIRKLLNWCNWGWKADRLRPRPILFRSPCPLSSPWGYKRNEKVRGVQQWIFSRGRESIPKRVINARRAAVRCSFTARKLDLKEHRLRNYMFLKGYVDGKSVGAGKQHVQTDTLGPLCHSASAKNPVPLTADHNFRYSFDRLCFSSPLFIPINPMTGHVIQETVELPVRCLRKPVGSHQRVWCSMNTAVIA